MNTNISIWSRILLVLASAFLAISIFVPLWQIELNAPQYPEGLGLKIYPNKLGGDVDIINGLNHYIGMKTLHAEDFMEFTVLPYIIGAFALFALVAAAIGKKKIVYTVFTMFVLFGIISMIDFWRWEYNYGHDLDPHAAIIVPGMAYQPPLIGYKKLLNFGAYSIPDIGGWLFVASGAFMLLATILEAKFFKTVKNNKNIVATLALITLFTSCGSSGPQPINLNTDSCDFCKMSIADNRFACEMLTEKGRVYKFDDVSCMIGYKDENTDKATNAVFYVCDYLAPNALASSEQLTFIVGEGIGSPMGGNIAAFTNKDSASTYNDIFKSESITWSLIKK